MERRPHSFWRLSFTYLSAAFVCLLLLVYVGPFINPDSNPHIIVAERSLHDDVVVDLTKRQTAYEKAQEKGNKLHCLMAMSQEEAKEANRGVSLESPDYLQEWGAEDVEGWTSWMKDEEAPYFKTYLNAALDGLGIEKDFIHEHWINDQQGMLFDNPLDPDIDNFEQIIPSGAWFTSSFILDAGVVIGDNAKAVLPAIREWNPRWEENGDHLTHIRQWSDAVWMQWTRVCEKDPECIQGLKYIFQAQITNAGTLEILFEALINKFGGRPTIGKWGNRITLDVNKEPDEFYAVLGSPHGGMTSYFLINHKKKLGIKTIDKVDIFVPNVPFTVVGTNADSTATGAKICFLFYVSKV